MKTTTIAALFVASVLLVGVAGATNPAYANHVIMMEGAYGEDPLSIWQVLTSSFFGIFGR